MRGPHVLDVTLFPEVSPLVSRATAEDLASEPPRGFLAAIWALAEAQRLLGGGFKLSLLNRTVTSYQTLDKWPDPPEPRLLRCF